MICSIKAPTVRLAGARPARPASVRPVRPVLVRAGGDLGDQAGQAARDVQKNVSRGAEDVRDAAADTGDKLKNRTDNAGDDAEGALKKAQRNVSRAAEDAKDNVQEGYDAAKHKAGDAAESVKEGVQDLGDRIQGKQ